MSGGVITNNGVAIIMDRTFNSPTYSVPSEFKVGNDDTAANITDTDLGHPVPITGEETVDDCETADWTDSADMTTSLNSSTYKIGSNSLNLTKDAGASADANTYKTTTSVDFTSKDFSLWLYIKDSTAYGKLATSSCLTIRFGSDSGNYYYWQKDKADLSTGWNLIDGLTSANADGTNGTPVIGACDYTFVQLTADAAATTWSNGDFMMDDIKVIEAGDYTKTFESGYPSVNETTKIVTIRTRITTTQANGYNIKEHCLVNTDGTPLMMTRDTFTSFSKSSTDELIFVEKITFDNSV